MKTQTPEIPPQTTRGQKSKQEVFDSITDAAFTLAIELKFLRESDYPELAAYLRKGEIENAEELVTVNHGMRLFEPWQLIGWLQLGKEYMDRYDISWADVRWKGLN
jgi:hypothetical protein